MEAQIILFRKVKYYSDRGVSTVEIIYILILQIALSSLKGTGPDGRIIKADVEEYLGVHMLTLKLYFLYCIMWFWHLILMCIVLA